jgi:predicted amidohydrolase
MQGETVVDAIFGESQNSAITGSVVIKESNNYYNRMLFVFLQAIQHYDKRHLFTLAGEDKCIQKEPKS